MSWWKPYKDVRASKPAPSTVILLFFHQKEDLTLKSPEITVKRELDNVVVFKLLSKFDKNPTNSVVFSLGDL